ncbi:centrosomal protein of 104 kDa-like isoform X2 [Branchiostoma floridae x Branchiostoma japonicum]
MPTKVPFKVIQAASQDDGFSAKELETHAPTVNGWVSSRFCLYPQELVLKLNERVRIRKLQLLSHQYLIATKVEFFVGEGNRDSLGALHGNNFSRLGYVSLSDNEKTGYRARELKSVHVDCYGQFIKIILHKNYINRFNLFNQVGLVAINIIGENKDSHVQEKPQPVSSEYTDPAMWGLINRPDYISPMDDLAFDMYQDPEVAQIIRKLDAKKAEAVRQERYDHAKKLKQAVVDLQKVGERLGKYEVEKRRAVENEDYDLAKMKKVQMEEYRLKVYQQLELHNLLDNKPTRPRNDPPPPQPRPPPREPDPPPPQPRTPPPPAQDQSPCIRENPAPTQSGEGLQEPVRQSYEERPIPTLRKQPAPAPEPEPDFYAAAAEPEDIQTSPREEEPEPMSEKNQREASAVIDVYGLPLVAGAYSKNWAHREDALLKVYKEMSEMGPDTPRDQCKSKLRAAIFLVQRSIKDKVFAVFSASLKLLKMILEDYIPQHKLGKADVTYCVEKTMPNLLAKTGDSAARQRVAALNYIQDMAQFKDVKPTHLVPHHATQPFKLTIPARLALSRVELVERLLKDLGLEKNSGLTVDNVMKFAVPALDHTAGEVRDAAVRVILDLYKAVGTPVRDYLPPDDQATRKKPLYKNIFDSFDRIDGKPTEAELKAQKQAAEKKKQEEIEQLQAQIAQLKDLQANIGKNDDKRLLEEARSILEDEEAGPSKGQFDLSRQSTTLSNTNSKVPLGDINIQINVVQKDEGKEDQKSKPPTTHSKHRPPPREKSTLNAPSEAGDDVSSLMEKMASIASSRRGSYLEEDSMCIFCGERNEAFTEEGLDLHYWKSCPMLRRCQHCKQVVEIAGLTEHLLTECDQSDNFQQCPRCTEAIPKDDYDEHNRLKQCVVAKPEKVANHCPLCHQNIPPGEEGWKTHLMGKDGCKNNPRRVQALEKKGGRAGAGIKGKAAAKSRQQAGSRVGVRGGKVGGKTPRGK